MCFKLEKLKLALNKELEASSAELKEGKVLNAQVSLSRDLGIATIFFPALIVYIILTSIFESYILNLFSSLILYLAFLLLILYHRTAIVLTPEKIVVHRQLFKTFVLQKNDLVKTSISKNLSKSLRWPLRFLLLLTIIIKLLFTVEGLSRGLSLRETAPTSVKLNLFLSEFMVYFFLLVIWYLFELTTPYQ